MLVLHSLYRFGLSPLKAVCKGGSLQFRCNPFQRHSPCRALMLGKLQFPRVAFGSTLSTLLPSDWVCPVLLAQVAASKFSHRVSIQHVIHPVR